MAAKWLQQCIYFFLISENYQADMADEDVKIDQLVSEWERRRYVPKPGEPELPPQLSDLANKTTEDVMSELNKLPFFMTELDENANDNVELEALRALAYEGEPHEIAANFKNQGNDCYKLKDYKNAVEFYTKGIEVDCNDDKINASLYSNRAACNLELKNYRRCIEDCKKVLIIDAKNVKACYRSGKAFFLVDRYEEAKQILGYGLTLDPQNASMKEVLENVISKEDKLRVARELKQKELEYEQMKKDVLSNSIKLRHYTLLKTNSPGEYLKDAQIRLEDEKDHESQLIMPMMILYPTIDEFDFVAEVSELSTPIEILELILDRPKEWFDNPKHQNFTVKKLECYMETESGGLIKVGKKIGLNNALLNQSPKVPLFDNSLRIFVVPKADAPEWLSTWNKQAALARRQM